MRFISVQPQAQSWTSRVTQFGTLRRTKHVDQEAPRFKALAMVEQFAVSSSCGQLYGPQLFHLHELNWGTKLQLMLSLSSQDFACSNRVQQLRRQKPRKHDM